MSLLVTELVLWSLSYYVFSELHWKLHYCVFIELHWKHCCLRTQRKIANIIRRGVIYIFLLICVSLLNPSCGHWTVCFYWTIHTKSKTNWNSAEDSTREPHVKVLTIDYHWFIAPEFQPRSQGSLLPALRSERYPGSSTLFVLIFAGT